VKHGAALSNLFARMVALVSESGFEAYRRILLAAAAPSPL
jgi:hypothetical protein